MVGATRSRVQVAVIPAAGRGTRMRPSTRAVPKALLPVVDRPAVQWVVEEAARAGASEVIVVTDADVAELIDRHFNSPGEPALEGLGEVRVRVVEQTQPRGLGDAVRCAGPAVEDRDFFCLLVDNLVYPGRDALPALAERTERRSVVCLRELTVELMARYGVVEVGTWFTAEMMEVLGAVEKPGAGAAPSKYGLVGRYLFTPEIFDALAETTPGALGEIQLTDAIHLLGKANRCWGNLADSDLLDVGTPSGYLEAITVLGAAHPRYGPEYLEFLRRLVAEA